MKQSGHNVLTFVAYGSQRNWHAYLDWSSNTPEHGNLSFSVRHVLEHFSIVAFKLTVPQKGGLNFNCMDRCSYHSFLPAVQVQRAARALDFVVQRHPNVLLPQGIDEDACSQIMAPLFPHGTPATIVTVWKSARGLARKRAWERVQHPHLDAYLTKVPMSRSLRAMSENAAVSKGRLQCPPRAEELHAFRILHDMVESVRAFAAAEGLPPLVLPLTASP